MVSARGAVSQQRADAPWQQLRRLWHRFPLFGRGVARVRRLELLPADRGYRVYHRQRCARAQGRLRGGRGALRRAAHELCPVLAAADALVEGLFAGLLQVCRAALLWHCTRQLFLLRHDDEHHARSGADGSEPRGECRRGDHERDKRRLDGGAGHLRIADGGEPLHDAFCPRHDHDCDRVEEDPLRGMEEGALHLHLPGLHADVCAHLHRFAFCTGGVEAHPARQGDDARAD